MTYSIVGAICQLLQYWRIARLFLLWNMYSVLYQIMRYPDVPNPNYGSSIMEEPVPIGPLGGRYTHSSNSFTHSKKSRITDYKYMWCERKPEFLETGYNSVCCQKVAIVTIYTGVSKHLTTLENPGDVLLHSCPELRPSVPCLWRLSSVQLGCSCCPVWLLGACCLHVPVCSACA